MRRQLGSFAAVTHVSWHRNKTRPQEFPLFQPCNSDQDPNLSGDLRPATFIRTFLLTLNCSTICKITVPGECLSYLRLLRT
jgi:hypothetical protein